MSVGSPKIGCLYGVGVGPGDPQLLTLRAVDILRQTSVICVPIAEGRSSSVALNIVKGYLTPEHEVLRAPFPTNDAPGAAAVWRETASLVTQRLMAGQDVAFLTEGDPMLYSTFSYVMAGVEELCPGAPIEIVPGVSSVTAAAARARLPLATHEQRVAILPAVYGIDDLQDAAANFDTVVLMKVNRAVVADVADLESRGLTGKSTYVRRATTERERVVRDLRELTDEDMDYFSLLIIQDRDKKR